MKSAFHPVLFVATLCFAPAQSWAQSTTTLYAYDVQGRLTQSGATDGATTTYVLDAADNRAMRRCCETIGGAQVLHDGFDPYFYLQTYADVRAAGMDPYQHWLQYGAAENRWPNRYFNTAWYRTTYGLAADVNPLTDYHESGWQARRNPSESFSSAAYQAHYADIVGMDPLQHYLRWGYGEGRSSFQP